MTALQFFSAFGAGFLVCAGTVFVVLFLRGAKKLTRHAEANAAEGYGYAAGGYVSNASGAFMPERNAHFRMREQIIGRYEVRDPAIFQILEFCRGVFFDTDDRMFGVIGHRERMSLENATPELVMRWYQVVRDFHAETSMPSLPHTRMAPPPMPKVQPAANDRGLPDPVIHQPQPVRGRRMNFKGRTNHG